MRRLRPRIDLKDPVVWTILSLGVPLAIALGVLAWGYGATNVATPVPDPSASPILGIAPNGQPVRLAPTLPPSTPTPAPPPDQYRVEGVVVDELGMPIADVCVGIGPTGCLEHSPRTDARGVYYADFPKANVQWSLYFIKDGYREQVEHLRLTRDLVLNIVLQSASRAATP